MAECVSCGKNLGFFDEKYRVSDGKCCRSCWYKARGFSIQKDEISSSDILCRVEIADAIRLARKRISGFYVQKCDKLGLGEENRVQGTLTDNECYYFCFTDGVLYQFEREYAYIERYNLQDKVTCKNDVDHLAAADLMYCAIPLGNIQYFSKDGDVKYTTSVSGGGGGGSSVFGAIVGGVIAGEAGAIIGSRQKVAPITTKTTTHNSTKTILKYIDGTELRTLIFFGHGMYYYLLKTIPEKDLASVQLQAVPKTDSIDVKQKLTMLKDLYEDGLIGEAEYNQKKQEIISQL